MSDTVGELDPPTGTLGELEAPGYAERRDGEFAQFVTEAASRMLRATTPRGKEDGEEKRPPHWGLNPSTKDNKTVTVLS
ncbi:hypothetical protein GCM10008097_24060 [Mycetocola manganoxydans]|nr:hypothetical protein GCM10008097_24060 [Mycetocola manganoxydans]